MAGMFQRMFDGDAGLYGKQGASFRSQTPKGVGRVVCLDIILLLEKKKLPLIAVKRLGGNCAQVDGPVSRTRRTRRCPTHSRHNAVLRAHECTSKEKGLCILRTARPSNLITNES
ncbi:hypothetical protein BOP93_04675 [Pseudomonas orientalis]|uniref:Uncharacterized protein n=1 Tax=Pseudomonas orientalis TaxID=76758 RepID=A0A2L0RSC1_9PSED|nr:hypothetical protein BOP93_04675 [Pseudomonas orientalis]